MAKTLRHCFEIPVPQPVVYQYAHALLTGDLVHRQLPEIMDLMIPMKVIAKEPDDFIQVGGHKALAWAEYTYRFNRVAGTHTQVELTFTVGGLVIPLSGDTDMVATVQNFVSFSAGWVSGQHAAAQTDNEFMMPIVRENI